MSTFAQRQSERALWGIPGLAGVGNCKVKA